MIEYYEARVLFDYDPVTSDELCLRAGETVEVRLGGGGEEEEEGWLYGSDLRGRHGTFPANYVADLRPPIRYSGDYGGGVSSSAPSFHRPGDVEHSGVGGVSAAISVDGAVAEANNCREDGVPATLGYSKHDSNRAPYDPAQDTAGSALSGEQGMRYTATTTAVANIQDENISENAPPATTSEESTTTQHAAASGAEMEGAISDQLPGGWLCGVDENSGVMYYYTADGKNSSWTRPTATAAAAADPLQGSSGDRKEIDGFTSVDPSSTSVSARVKACLNDVDDDEKDRQERELAATRIQAITRGNRFRKKSNLGKAAAATNNPRRRPRDSGEPQHLLENADHGGRRNAANSTGNCTVFEGAGGAPSTVNGSGEVSGGTQGTSAGTASAAGGGGGGETVEIDRKTATLIASLVDERITEEMNRRDAILSDIRETMTVLADRLVAESPERKTNRKPPPSLGKRTGRTDGNTGVISAPPRLRREKARAPLLPRTPKHSPSRKSKSKSYGAPILLSAPPGPPSPQRSQAHQQALSPGRTNRGSSQPPAETPNGGPIQQPPFYYGSSRGGGGGGGGFAGGGRGRDPGGKVCMPLERSPSPPSRSQPLRALVDCGGYQDTQDNVATNRNVAFHLDEDDHADLPRTPERGRRQEEEKYHREDRGGKPAHAAASPPSALPLPRVADLEGVQRTALEKQKAKAAEAAALVKNNKNNSNAQATNNGHGRTTLYHPSWYETSVVALGTSVPDSGLALEYVHGYAGETPDVLGSGGRHWGGRSGDFGGGGGGGAVGAGGASALQGRVGGARNSATRSTNVVWLRSGEIVFPAAAVVVIHDFEVNRQRFFTGHDEEVTAVAVHPRRDIVVSGQAGKEAIVCLFDATRRWPEEGDSGASGSTATPEFLREFSLGRKETQGVAALDFSPDGNLVLAMAGSEGQSLSVWDWQRGERLATARAERFHLSANSVRFNPCLFLHGSSAEGTGLRPPGAACYTLVSCGERHVRFWTLTRDRCARLGDAAAGSDDTGWEWNLTSRPGNFGMRGEIDSMTCLAFIGEPREGREERQRRRRAAGHETTRLPLPMARVITGAEKGQIYFWEVTEEGQEAQHQHQHQQQIRKEHPQHHKAGGGGGGAARRRTVGWQPRGRLLAVVPNAHDGPITDICYLPHGEDGRGSASPTAPLLARNPSGHNGGEDGGEEAREWGRLATCGGEGTLRLWGVVGVGPSPLQLLLTVEVSSRGVGIGHPRSVSWDRSGTTLALGTVGNAVCLVQPGEGNHGQDIDVNDARGKARRPGSVMFMLAVQGHTGSCRALAPHPSRPWFVTGGSDSVLRLWDARSRRQLSAARLLERVCSAAFHPNGDVLAVGNEAGDFFLMALRTPPLVYPDGDRRRGADTAAAHANNAAALGFSWDVLARKRIIVGGPAQRSSNSSNINTATTNTAANSNSGGPTGPEASSYDDGGATNIPVAANAIVGSGVGEGFGPVDGRKAGAGVGCRGRRSKTTKTKRSGAAPAAGESGSSSGGGDGGAEICYLSPPRPPRGGKDGFPSPNYRVSPRSTVAPPPGLSPAAKAMIAVSVLRFSPDGGALAAACGISIHLYREVAAAGTDTAEAGGAAVSSSGRGAYRRYAACKGHATKVRSFDFSRDGSVLQSNDASGELLFWDVSTGKQITNGFSVRDVEMDSWSCLKGWPTQGLGSGGSGREEGVPGGGGVLAVCRSNDEDVMAVGDEDSCVSLVRNPAPVGTKARANWGHTSASGVSGLAFLYDDRRLISVGGTCVFVWRHVRQPPPQYETGYEKQQQQQQQQHLRRQREKAG